MQYSLRTKLQIVLSSADVYFFYVSKYSGCVVA
jgi:hypothetical protein